MRRSEMIEVLLEAIEDNYDYSIDCGHFYDCDTILSKLEEAGMLPPCERYKNECLSCGGPHYICRWEKED